ncbi:NADH-quinone oxidoreductase subunit NuoE [Mycobacterium sp. pUA109]|uniref:NADH-quinone oxidoreductase subunit NuoE n=1 Tax=Mycobacterium sp. pUA109 TaxID=3238982 RepID=UPI00351B5D07
MTAPSAGTGGERIFLQLGRPPDEPGQFESSPDAPRSYPAEVRARLEADAQQIIDRYTAAHPADEDGNNPAARSAILSLLHLVQAEDSYLTPAGLAFCAEQLGLTGAEVAAVASFYSMYRRGPTGEYLVGVCTNTLCAMMGGDAIFEALTEHLGIGNDDTTADGTVTLQHVECNAACDYAPVVMVNWEFFDRQTPESARALVDALRSGESVTPTRGAPLCSFRHTERVLAGFPDERPDTGQGGPGAPTLAGLRVAQRQGISAPDGDGQ